MGAIDSILQLQERFRAMDEEYDGICTQFEELTALYGRWKDRGAKREELLQRRAAISPEARISDHPDLFDDRHNRRLEDGKDRFTNVPGCPSCDAIRERFGLIELAEKIAEIDRQNRETRDLALRLKELREGGTTIINEINQLARSLGLPDFEATVEDGSGFILGTGDIVGFTINGRPILDSGTYVEYMVGEATYYVALDDSEQVVAHYTGSGDWHLSGLGSRMLQHVDDQVKVKAGGGFSYDHQVPTTDIVIAPRDGTGDRLHIVIDDEGNVIMDEWHRKSGN